MKIDLPSVAEKVAKFLGKALPENPEGMKAFMEHLSFDKMKTNKAVNKDDFMTVSQGNIQNRKYEYSSKYSAARKGVLTPKWCFSTSVWCGKI